MILNLVLVHEADVEAVDHNGLTPLCIATKLGYDILTEVGAYSVSIHIVQ